MNRAGSYGAMSVTVPKQEGYRTAQRLAYKTVLSVACGLETGITEREASERIAAELGRRGVTNWFHRPFAWFGERSRFQDMRRFKDFLPTERRLAAGEVAILDCAPMVGGFACDVGYAFSPGPHEELARAREWLWQLRQELPGMIESAPRAAEVWREVDARMVGAGYTNCYRLYPFSVLGHRVGEFSPQARWGGSIPISQLSWFGRSTYGFIFRHGLFPPLLRSRSGRLAPGLWAIEPHLGGAGFGAKFEELLVVDSDGRARWLDDEVPHRVDSKR